MKYKNIQKSQVGPFQDWWETLGTGKGLLGKLNRLRMHTSMLLLSILLLWCLAAMYPHSC